MSGPADIEACHERLHRAGWPIGEVGTRPGSRRSPNRRRRSSHDGLEHLRDLPALQFSSLAGKLVTDAGLEKLRDLPQLRTLSLGYTKVTQEAVDELARSRPDMTVGLKVLPKDKGQRRRP